MKHTIEGFSQEYALTFRKRTVFKSKEREIKLDCTDLVILRWFVDFYPNMRKMTVDGKEYAWVLHKKLLADLPLLDISPRGCGERLQKLSEFGILDSCLLKDGGTYSLYTFGPNYYPLVSTENRGVDVQTSTGDVQASTGDVQASTGVTFKCLPGDVQTSTGERSNVYRGDVQTLPKDISIINTSIKNESIRDSSIRDRESVGEGTPPTRTAYGRFNNVFLSDKEFSDLEKTVPNNDYYIERLSMHMESTGATYNSHFATMLKWWHEDLTKEAEKNGGGKADVQGLVKQDAKKATGNLWLEMFMDDEGEV